MNITDTLLSVSGVLGGKSGGGGGSNMMRAVFSFNEETETFGCDKTFEEITTAIQNGDYVYGYMGADGDSDVIYFDKLTPSAIRFGKCQIVPVNEASGTTDYIVYNTVVINANNDVVTREVRHPLS